MANITVTHTFVNGTTADATEVNTNFTDIINGTSDGTKDFSISALTVAGTANLNGAANLNGNTTLGNATGDTITFTGRVASDIDPDTTASYSFGSTSLTYKDLYLDNGATDGGAIYFNAVNTAFIKSDASAGDLDISGFTNLDINSLNITQAGSITATGTLTNTGASSLDGAVTINESGAAVDFRVEGDTDTDLLFVDASTDRVGISTNSPSALFHVAGASTLDGAVTINESGADVDTRIEASGEANALFIQGSDGAIGIGTGAPSEKLDINDNTAGKFTISAYNANATGDGIYTAIFSAASTEKALEVQTNNTANTALVVLGDGSVGIGTASPDSFNSGGLPLVIGSGSGGTGATIYSGTTSTGSLHFADGTTGNESYRGYLNYDHNVDGMNFGTSGSTRMTIDSSGNVEINSSGSGAQLEVEGSGSRIFRAADSGNTSTLTAEENGNVEIAQYSNGTLSVSAGVITSSSDERLKTEINPLYPSLDKLLRLEPITYKWKKAKDKDEVRIGFTSQSVQPYFPELIGKPGKAGISRKPDKNGPEKEGYLGFHYADMVAVLTKAIQELSAKVDALEAKLAG